MLKLLQQIMVPGLEILIIGIMIYYLLLVFWNTRAMDVLFGSIAVLIFFMITNYMHLPVLQELILYVVNVAAIAVLILFQPELRWPFLS